MLFVDINLYNPDQNVFVLVNLYIEIPPTAGLLPRVSVNTLKLLQDEHCQVTSQVLLLVLSLWTGLMQAAELAACGWWDYVTGIAHDMHLTATVVGVVVSIMGIVRNCRSLDPDSDRALAALRSDEFVDLLTERYSYDEYRYVVILLLFLSCGRLLFLSDFGRHSKLTSTLYRSLPNMVSFSFMFAILMCSFSMLAYLVFGTDLYVFRTFRNSLFVLIEVITGQLDYQSLATTNRFLGPLFYMAFIFFVVFVLYNMFIVILNDTYYVVREEAAAAEEVEMYEVAPFIKNCLRNLWGCLHLPVTLPKRRRPPRKVVQMRTLRTLLLDCKVPHKAGGDGARCGPA
ncbi:polycystic kidney disease 2-like 1 protein isoform X4 [Frankliniella occidentalis]|uniref:Polycystic kidney disease 2-like 1 protein isoform X4 n=1 Tax=Frankliniella occidentalis TaxID=133901 RepID=A0A9C6X3M6_FRAOC|nr:polycystic kidney disease 2-like 1 protein isoform X4 [Frankliniella occidentalis]